jgi:hypothetical protein
MSRAALTALVLAVGAALTGAQEVAVEYQVKAAYLYNFVKYVEWPDKTKQNILICVAGQNPFGAVLETLTRNERVRGIPLGTEIILEARTDCDVLFTPKTSNVPVYLKAAAGLPILTVGESPRFLEQGGIIRFVVDGPNVRFEINLAAAERAKLKISSRLLQLARIVDAEER